MPRYHTDLCGGGATFDLLRSPLTIATAKDTPGRPGYAGEIHGVFIDGKDKGTRAQYLGPRTKFDARQARGDPGVNDVDRVALQHDRSYSSAHKQLTSNSITKQEFTNQIQMADDEFIKNIARTKDAPLTASIAKKAIQLKALAEELGVLDSAIFSGAGACCKHLFPPDYLLRKEASKKTIKGGLGPLAIALIGALAPTAIEGVIALGKKLFGKGKAPKNPLHQASMILDELPETKQIDLLHTVIRSLGDQAFSR